MQRLVKITDAYVQYLTQNGVFSLKDLFVSRKVPYKSISILKNINLTINKGDTIAIFGKNGSGKSTLLRLISKIVKPARGLVELNGIAAPIMALGVGLEMELTGYENIELALGLMQKKNDEKSLQKIISFSELNDETLKKALKTYSTGMIARLSFAVSFLSEADIYIIDEVLAVGDLGFQRKCIEHIHSLKQQNKTIVFVSHNPEEMKAVCEKGILMIDGEIASTGTSNQIAEQYTQMFN